MPALTKYHSFVDELAKGGHNLATAAFKCALTDTAPNQATDTVWNATVAPPPAAANGYPSGGVAMTTSSAATTAGVFKLVLDDAVFTAAGGSIGPFRYPIVYNSTQGNKLVGYYDNGSSQTLPNSGDVFTVDTDPANGVLTIAWP